MDSLLKEKNKGFSLVELLVVLAVLVIIMGTAALTMGTAMRDSRTRKAAFEFKAMLVDGSKTAMATYKEVIAEWTGSAVLMYEDGDASFSYNGGNDTVLAYFLADGSLTDPGRPDWITGDYYFIPSVQMVTSLAGGGNSLDLSGIYGTGFENVPILDSTAKIILRPEGVNVIKVGVNDLPAGLVSFRHVDDIDEETQERQYFVLISKTFIRVLKMEDDGTGNFVPKEL